MPRTRTAAEKKATCQTCGHLGHYKKFCYVKKANYKK